MSAGQTIRVVQVAGDDRTALLTITGAIDERFDASLLSRLLAPITILQLDGISRITSFGVRQWSEAMKRLPPETKHIYLLGCSPSFIDQLNMVLNFGGRAEVITANGVFFCPKCNDERIATIDVYGDRSKIASGRVGDVRCNVCSGPLQLEDDPFAYLRFAVTYGAKSIDPRAQALLAEAGVYRVREAGRPPEEMKLIHGEVTLLCLSGTLDHRFQPRRLASGVEGEVVFDLAGVDGADATGCERWAKLLGQLKHAAHIIIVDAPEPLFAPIAEGQLELGNATLHSVSAAWRCNWCNKEYLSSLTPQPWPPPPRPCPQCGTAMTLVSDLALLERVFGKAQAHQMPVSAAVEEVIARRGELVAEAKSESDKSAPSAGTVSTTRYKLLKQLSQGGMGEILLAIHQGIGGFEKLVALKKIRRDMLDQRQVATDLFLAEAKLAANLNHPNIVQIFEIGQRGGDLFIAMEYIHGADVRTLLRDAARPGGAPIPLDDVLYIGKQVASALHHAHVATDLNGQPLGIVHRDVSPSNIVVGFDGQVKLVDFGIAAAHSTNQTGLIGKVSYMSPEQVSGQPLDGRSDVFSLAVVLYELITRRPLFKRDNDEQTTRAVWVDPLPSLKSFGVPDYIEQALAHALERMRDKRYPDAHAFEMALGECLAKLRSTVSNASLSSLLKERFPLESAAPPVETGTGSGSRPRSGDYLDVVPVEEAQTSLSKPSQPVSPFGNNTDSSLAPPATPIMTPTEVRPVFPAQPAPTATPPPPAKRSRTGLLVVVAIAIVVAALIAVGLIYSRGS